uniref:CSON009635 protein n=1 Tax=Culicoides sonorensis TaxID=179676 RepID=A0A336LH40_CULSO
MDIKIIDFDRKFKTLLENIENKSLKSELTQDKHKNLLKNLGKCILESNLTQITAELFPEIIVLVFQELFNTDVLYGDSYKWKVVALAKLIDENVMLKNLAYNHFKNNQMIFWEKAANDSVPSKQRRLDTKPPNDAEIVKAAYYLLKSDPSLFKQLWKWSEFLEIYWNKGTDEQKYFCNKIIGILTGVGQAKVSQLNSISNISEKIILNEGESKHNLVKIQNFDDKENDITIQVPTSDFINVEGVFLPIFDKSVAKVPGDVQMVSSTKTNLRSLALAVASNKPVCLNGPVGCGKTMLVEYLAKMTGRMVDFCDETETPTVNSENQKRKRKDSENLPASKEMPLNAMLRIQLGDQTDSKTLLGQYRCTDVPGEFVWQPGVLTQAVMQGSWLMLEDLNAATQDVCTVLTGLLENNFLSVPGFRDNLKIEPGFQLFLTMR